MKEYRFRQKCWCGGPERCELCAPTTEEKKKLRRIRRKQLKEELRKQDKYSSEDERIWIKYELRYN